MTERDSRDDASSDCNQQEIAIVTANPVITARRLAQMLGSPVRHDIAVVTIFAGDGAALPIPTFMSAPVMHHGIALMLFITAAVVILQNALDTERGRGAACGETVVPPSKEGPA